MSVRRRAAPAIRSVQTPVPPTSSRARRPGEVPLARALSKLGIASRSDAIRRILAGEVAVNGLTVRDPGRPIVPERDRLSLAGSDMIEAAWRTILLNKPKGSVTTRRDPDGRPTVYGMLPHELRTLAAIGRLDLSTTGLLLLTTDTQLAHWLTDPARGVPRTYLVTVRGLVAPETAARLERGIVDRGERLAADSVTIRKASRRETHLVIVLKEGRNREIRRLFRSVDHDVTRLSRVAFGGLTLGDLPAGKWRDITRDQICEAFPGAPLRGR